MVSSAICIIVCHPVPGSFTAAVAETVTRTAQSLGCEVSTIDLYHDGFNPLSPSEDVVVAHRDTLTRADTLVLVYPTWWSAQPAMLQGWIDSVWHRHDTDPHEFASIRRIVVCTTHGSPKWLNALEGESGKRTVTRYMRGRCAPRCRVRWISLYGMDGIDDAGRRRHLQSVDRRLRRLFNRR